ncbi:unnamed protein product, partial [Brenthis ino]
MDKYFEGKRVLVTGGCQGIGKGIVLELWRLGANVVALSHQADNLNKLKNEYPSIEIACVDLCDWDKTRKVIDSLGVFDGLVNCAGFIYNQPFLECSPEIFAMTMDVNVKAILNVSQVIAKKMIANKIKGAIVNISSQTSMVWCIFKYKLANVCSSSALADLFRLLPLSSPHAAIKDHVAYASSKAAVDAMTRVMALELGPHGIRVNAINPTVILTELGRRAWADPVKAQNMLSKIPLGRFGEVHEAVNAIVFLLSDKASMINGVQLPVDGGFLAT